MCEEPYSQELPAGHNFLEQPNPSTSQLMMERTELGKTPRPSLDT